MCPCFILDSVFHAFPFSIWVRFTVMTVDRLRWIFLFANFVVNTNSKITSQIQPRASTECWKKQTHPLWIHQEIILLTQNAYFRRKSSTCMSRCFKRNHNNSRIPSTTLWNQFYTSGIQLLLDSQAMRNRHSTISKQSFASHFTSVPIVALLCI